MKTSRNFVLLIAALVALTAMPHAAYGRVQTSVTATASFLSNGRTSVAYEIRNTGEEKILHVRVATFLGLLAEKSDSLGDNAPGSAIRYACQLDTSTLTPGSYIMATRVNFEDQAGASHAVLHFTPLTYGAPAAASEGPLTIAVSNADFNVKSPINTGKHITLTLKNRGRERLRPVVSLFLPDGVTTPSPETAIEVAAGETKTVKVPLKFDPSVQEDTRYHAVAWYETGGRHDARLLEGVIHITQKPVLFKAFLIAGGVILLAVILFVLIRRRKN